MELFLKYYTLDWLAMALSLLAVYLLGNKNKYGFISFSKNYSKKNRGHATEESKEALFETSYNEANMIDVIIVVSDKIISNYLHNLTEFEIDFPVAEKI